MADEKKKGVTVVAISNTSRDGHVYKDGAEASIHDEGHLSVYDASGKAIAIYAPGKWANVVIEGQ